MKDPKICPRCKNKNNNFMISVFTDEVICVDCLVEETKHPRYKESLHMAQEAEAKGVKYEGLGWPPRE